MNADDFDRRMAPLAGSAAPLLWREAFEYPFRLSGFPWFGKDRVYRRLPVGVSGKIPRAVDELANCTAGGQVAFRSDSDQLAIRVELAGLANMNHMPATGQCGFDLYLGPPLKQRFHSVTKYDHTQTRYEVLIFDHPLRRMRHFMLNFPLYQGVKRVQIGLVPDARVEPPSAWAAADKIVAYGTSITQGGCASRPGLAYTNILSRLLNIEVINLGFSGSGKGEPEVVALVAEVPDPLLFVLDYEANAGETLAKTLPDAIRIIRKRRVDVPILVVSRIPFSTDITHPAVRRSRQTSRDMQSELVRKLRKAGDKQIRFVDGGRLLGDDFDECTVDGVHPNDLGFMRMAWRLKIEIQRILRRKPNKVFNRTGKGNS